MTAAAYERLGEFMIGCIDIAKAQGLAPGNPVVISMLGAPTMQGHLYCPQRYVHVAYERPLIEKETIIWVDVANRRVWKANPADKLWRELFEYEGLMEWVEWLETTHVNQMDNNGNPV